MLLPVTPSNPNNNNPSSAAYPTLANISIDTFNINTTDYTLTGRDISDYAVAEITGRKDGQYQIWTSVNTGSETFFLY